MPRRDIQIIKKGQARVSGSVRLGPGTALSRPAAVAPVAASVPQQARVIESNNEYAVIEVICSCGAKMHIQCNYAHLNQ